ncbi:formylglycine-generating enzyme family protein [Pseudomonas typographi]|uniref:formylglycine-generating enzyme family protein n=1 Tax=Pseudomonas typographi TaxID=2715964 RepID=UPI0016893CE3|nr:formylglycine-generating enzyme family protein [Pseudomonas typographi]MBD1552021.1 formylglycine-generating enzyme family protein [Pseudomonas typographi]
MTRSCCTPSRERNEAPLAEAKVLMTGAGSDGQMLAIPAGSYRLGGEGPQCNAGDGEGPVRDVWVDGFLMDVTAVTNAQFALFVTATGFRTDAERFGESFVFAGLLGDTQAPSVAQAPWWKRVPGAYWRAPEGPGSTVAGRAQHPVVHVSWRDASAYAQWCGKRLPTEAEWEAAARGGRVGGLFPWGDELVQGGVHRCNVWQGRFPDHDSGEDGFVGTAPANSFEPNGYGLYNMLGNVWEWCADYWSHHAHSNASPQHRHNPGGPAQGTSRVIRGGSYLCHASYCNRYRLSARSHNTPDSSTGHMGFRCVM